jgi:hypothetical protein
MASIGPTWICQTVHVGEEYERGHRRTLQVPDARAMTEVLEAANAVTQYGVLRFADYSGANIQALVNEAVAWVAQNLPSQDGASLVHSEELSTPNTRRSSEGY